MIRSYALSLAGILAAFLLGGIVWGGLLRPGMPGVKVADGLVPASDPGTSPQFLGYAWFVIITVLISLLVGVLVHLWTQRGLGMMLWVVLLCLVGGFVFHVAGDSTAMAVHPTPDLSALAEGDAVSVVPRVAPGVAYLVGPFIAGLAYWIGMVLDSGIVSSLRGRKTTPATVTTTPEGPEYPEEPAGAPQAPGKAAPRRVLGEGDPAR